MNAIKIGIVGQGRIGRCLMRQLTMAGHEVVGVSEPLLDAERLAYLLKHDSLYGQASFSVSALGDSHLTVAGKSLRLLKEPIVTARIWDSIGADIVVDCSNRTETQWFEKDEAAWSSKPIIATHLCEQAKATWIRGANDDKIDPAAAHFVSAGTCTGNCLLPVVRVLRDCNLGLKGGALTVLHPVLSTQSALDNPNPNPDLSFSRGSMRSAIKAPTRLMDSLGIVFPELKPHFSAVCYRLPTEAVLVIDAIFDFERPIHMEALSEALENAAATTHREIIAASREPLASIDYLGAPWSAAVDLFRLAPGKRQRHRLTLFQDNEWGYTKRVVDLVERIATSRNDIKVTGKNIKERPGRSLDQARNLQS